MSDTREICKKFGVKVKAIEKSPHYIVIIVKTVEEYAKVLELAKQALLPLGNTYEMVIEEPKIKTKWSRLWVFVVYIASAVLWGYPAIHMKLLGVHEFIYLGAGFIISMTLFHMYHTLKELEDDVKRLSK